MRSTIHRAMTHLIFMLEVGKSGGGMWLRGANQLVLCVFYNEITIWQHFTLHVTTLETCTTNMDIKLGFHWQMTHVESANDVVHLHNIER
jgi:hypothetical protein